jgi:sRNA-binding regulator protein Hfq
MGYLKGLDEYLEEGYEKSIFDFTSESGEPYIFHVHGLKVLNARIKDITRYDLILKFENGNEELLPKIQIKFTYPAQFTSASEKMIKSDKKLKEMKLEPIYSPRHRHFVKNKSLFPLMKDRQVLFFTLLEGEIIRGIVSDFSRYDITVRLKGGIPLTILRHAIYDLRDKKGRCYLKSFQEEHRDWEKSHLYITE